MQKQFLLLILILACVLAAPAQDKFTNCEKTSFRNTKKISTEACYDGDRRKGIANAYDRQGKKIYSRELRHIYGSASVRFTYYDDGAVKTADYYSAPDGGIQWDNVITYFAEDGTITHEDNRGYEEMHHPYFTQPAEPARKPEKTKKEVVRCAPIFVTEYWFVNSTRGAVVGLAERIGNPKDIKAIVVQPGDTVKGGEFVMAAQFVNLEEYYRFSARPVAGNKLLHMTQARPEVGGTDRRRCYYVITRKR